MGKEPDDIRREIEDTRDRMGDTVDQLTSKADVGQRVKDSVADKRDRLMGQMEGSASRLNDVTPDASDVRDGAKQAVGFAQQNPLGLAIGGVAVGFLAGLALPSTRIEDERMGAISDDVMDRAKAGGQEALDRGKQVAQDVAETAQETVPDVVDAAVDSAHEIADAAGESAEKVKETAKESGSEQAEELRAS